MKIRTDFVTNSSSSSFVLEICIDLVDGKSLLFSANGGTGETGIIDYFWSDATVNVSPKQLGSAKSVQELIELLKNGVYDGWVSEGDKLFENKSAGGYKRKHNPTHFTAMIQEYVKSMDDISRIVISGSEEGMGWGNVPYYYRAFAYSPKTGDYTCQIEGDAFEKDGSSGGDLIFSDESEAHEVEAIEYGYDAITTKGYAIQKGKEAKQKLREAIASGSVEILLGEAGTAGELSIQYAREVSAAPETLIFRGKNYVHTSCTNEEMIDKFVLSKGGEVRSSTVLATDYLIIGNDIGYKTTKISRALELKAKGKAIIAMTESEFWTLAAANNEDAAQMEEPVASGPLRVCITGAYPEFTKNDFEKFVLAHGMIYKPQSNHQCDYIIADNDNLADRLREHYKAQVGYLSDFLRVIGISEADFYAEVSSHAQNAKEEKVQNAAMGICEKEILDLEHIPDNAYANDLSLKSIRIGGQVKTIGKNAFFNCSNLSTIILTDGIEEIGEDAFRKCVALESIEIPPSIKTIKENAFFGCKKLASVTFHEGLEELQKDAFRASPRLAELTLPKSLKNVRCSFSGCKIKKLVIPEGMDKIWLSELELKMEYIKLPSTVKEVQIDTAYGKHVTEIDYAGTVLDFFKISFGTTGINTRCFVRCEDGVIDFSGDEIVIPEGVSEIRDLFDWRKCKTIQLSSTLRIIGGHSLYLKELIELTVPEGVMTIEDFAVWCDSLEKLRLPSTLGFLGAFALSGCMKLSEIYYAGTKAQWGEVAQNIRGRRWDESLPSYTVFCADGNISKKR